jgi:hypothetical protein
MIYCLHIHEVAAAEVKVHTGAVKLLVKQRQVEAVAVKTGKITSCEMLGKRFGHHGKRGRIGHIVVSDMVYFGSLGRYRHLGIDATCLDYFRAVGHHFDYRDLNDTVMRDISAGGFQIEENDRTS